MYILKFIQLATISNIIVFVNGLSEKEQWLHYTNLYRCIHNSSNVTWSEAAADSAQRYADSLELLRHSDAYNDKPPEGPAGENLAMGYHTIKDVVEAWYNEVNCCKTFPGCLEKTCVTGHFTALVWRGVTEIGCGINKRIRIYVCRYRSGDTLSANTANMQGYYKLMVRKPLNDKSKCYDIFNNLNKEEQLNNNTDSTEEETTEEETIGGESVTGDDDKENDTDDNDIDEQLFDCNDSTNCNGGENVDLNNLYTNLNKLIGSYLNNKKTTNNRLHYWNRFNQYNRLNRFNQFNRFNRRNRRR